MLTFYNSAIKMILKFSTIFSNDDNNNNNDDDDNNNNYYNNKKLC